jgi:hypothetical protein
MGFLSIIGGEISGPANMNLLPAELRNFQPVQGPTRSTAQTSVAPAQVSLQALNAEGIPTASPAEPIDYEAAYESIGAEPSADVKQQVANEMFGREYGGGMSKAELGDFETLIGRLESSKMRQAGKGNRARQRETFAKGLANMMKNF